MLIQQNLELRPESSHNVNFLWNLKNKTGNSNDWQLQVNFILRSIRDLIRPFPIIAQGAGDAILSQNQNIFSSTSQGFELTGTWKNLIKGLTLDANTTYQRFFNTSDSGPFTRNKGDRIPLEPYFFANGKAEYELKNIIRQNDNLSFFWNTRFVHSFFIGWEGDGANFQQFKDQVPNQTIHAAGITYRMNIKKLQNAITLEVQNLTNEKVFDFFGVQRPGRAFYIKSTIQF